MPKEKLNYDRVIVHSANALKVLRRIPDETYPAAEGDVWHEQALLVQLHWSPDAYAQFSVTLDRAKVQEQLAEQADVSTVTFYGECLERGEMNGAVKALRRARNAVHGSDE